MFSDRAELIRTRWEGEVKSGWEETQPWPARWKAFSPHPSPALFSSFNTIATPPSIHPSIYPASLSPSFSVSVSWQQTCIHILYTHLVQQWSVCVKERDESKRKGLFFVSGGWGCTYSRREMCPVSFSSHKKKKNGWWWWWWSEGAAARGIPVLLPQVGLRYVVHQVNSHCFTTAQLQCLLISICDRFQSNKILTDIPFPGIHTFTRILFRLHPVTSPVCSDHRLTAARSRLITAHTVGLCILHIELSPLFFSFL